MASLDVPLPRVDKQVDSALSLLETLPNLQGVARHYIAEMIIIRIFALFESVVEESACRLVCGAAYSDGTTPQLLCPRPTHGFLRALNAMRNYNRTKPRTLRWNKPAEIRANLDRLLSPSEHFITTLRAHGHLLSDLRKVRNHIAHANRRTGTKFQQVVLNYYGAKVPSLTPGRMLLSPRFTPSLAAQWCRKTRIILRTALRA